MMEIWRILMINLWLSIDQVPKWLTTITFKFYGTCFLFFSSAESTSDILFLFFTTESNREIETKKGREQKTHQITRLLNMCRRLRLTAVKLRKKSTWEHFVVQIQICNFVEAVSTKTYNIEFDYRPKITSQEYIVQSVVVLWH